MSRMQNPAVKAFIAQLGDEAIVAQVWIRRTERGFQLRHVNDRAVSHETLSGISLSSLRDIATFTAARAFRPLKSAPNLRAGWFLNLRDESELDLALNQLYPGALADWYATQADPPPLTSFRDFTERQTGMYRIPYKLTDDQAARVIRTSCHSRFCLKRRLWSAPGAPADSAPEKSLVPCLEPCAMLLELARKMMRIEQEQKISVPLGRSEWETVMQALESALERPGTGLEREADLDNQMNPRRVRCLLDKLRTHSASIREN